jgi:hypothetical protein
VKMAAIERVGRTTVVRGALDHECVPVLVAHSPTGQRVLEKATALMQVSPQLVRAQVLRSGAAWSSSCDLVA